MVLTAILANKNLLGVTSEETKIITTEKATSIPDWNFMAYIAANNNLANFSITNIRQMIKVGSNSNINLIVQLDHQEERNISRYYLKKGEPLLASSLDFKKNTISGTPESLFEFIKWSVEKFPAKRQCLVLWNHGSGIKDPNIWGRALIANRDRLFNFNAEKGLIEINRESINNRIGEYMKKERGIGFNDKFEEYLTNQDLKNALEKACREVLGGKKFDLICMDACHMAMVEVASQIKGTADYFSASQEVEPGTGYNYTHLLSPFEKMTLTPEQFAIHVVNSYKKEYHTTHGDYTQSAIRLTDFEKVENNIKTMTKLTLMAFNRNDIGFNVNILQPIRLNKRLTVFADTDYIDFCHFYSMMIDQITQVLGKRQLSEDSIELLKKIQEVALQGLNMMQNHIVANTSGVNLPKAYGLSLYLPTKKIDSSYLKTVFDNQTQWSAVCKAYLGRI